MHRTLSDFPILLRPRRGSYNRPATESLPSRQRFQLHNQVVAASSKPVLAPSKNTVQGLMHGLDVELGVSYAGDGGEDPESRSTSLQPAF